MRLFEPILVTPDEYYAIGFALVIIGLLYTMYQAFNMPNEREDDEDF
jgi:hypothetical protein